MYGDPRERYIPGNRSIPQNPTQYEKDQISRLKQSKLRAEQSHKHEDLSVHKSNHHETIENPQDNNKNTTKEKHFNFLRKILFILFIPLVLLFIKFFIDYSSTPKLDTWTSKPITLGVVFNANNTSDLEKANVLSQSIMMELNEYSRFSLLERIDLQIIKEELDLWMSKYSKSEKNEVPDILKAKLMLIVDLKGSDQHRSKVNETENFANIFMRLCNAQKAEVIEILNEKLKQGSILSQRKRISRNLIRKLQELYPRCGKIIKNANKNIQINIGSKVGVKIGQLYQVVGRNIVLEIVSVDSNFSYVSIKTDNVKIENGWKVKEILGF